jgi:hypothetical protein
MEGGQRVLTIVVGDEGFDDAKQEFAIVNGVELQLEHSLVALSKWESIFEKPFLGEDEKTTEEVVGYIKAMVVGPDIPPEVFSKLSEKNFAEIDAYINRKMTATWFSELPGAPKSREIVTSELIYYWLVTFNIPFECETWHLNRLFTLIRIFNIKNAAPKKMSRSELAARNRALNEQRRKQLNSSG